MALCAHGLARFDAKRIKNIGHNDLPTRSRNIFISLFRRKNIKEKIDPRPFFSELYILVQHP